MPQKPQPAPSQDWSTMVLNGKKGARAATVAPPVSAAAAKDRKLDIATEAEKKELLPRAISAQLMAARVTHVPKLSQKDLARQLNIPQKTVQEIEQHRHENNMALAQRIARHLGVKLVKN
jgi:ribosome-binding protein aMBF1 (putative translation factor)